MVGSRGLFSYIGVSRHLLLPLLSLLLRFLRLQILLISVVLGLFPNVDVVLLRSRIHIKQLPFILYSRDVPDCQRFDLLFLLGSGHGQGV